MKTATELGQDIINITMRIQQEFPELTKYIKEMPVKVSGNHTADLNIKNLEEYYNSLAKQLSEYSKTHASIKVKNNTDKSKVSDYPLYPNSEDIYSQGKQEMALNPEDLSKDKAPNEIKRTSNEKGFKDDMSGDDLDVPGAELDDQQESVGSEDEENNYYSIGGDNHNDLDEDKG